MAGGIGRITGITGITPKSHLISICTLMWGLGVIPVILVIPSLKMDEMTKNLGKYYKNVIICIKCGIKFGSDQKQQHRLCPLCLTVMGGIRYKRVARVVKRHHDLAVLSVGASEK